MSKISLKGRLTVPDSGPITTTAEFQPAQAVDTKSTPTLGQVNNLILYSRAMGIYGTLMTANAIRVSDPFTCIILGIDLNGTHSVYTFCPLHNGTFTFGNLTVMVSSNDNKITMFEVSYKANTPDAFYSIILIP